MTSQRVIDWVAALLLGLLTGGVLFLLGLAFPLLVPAGRTLSPHPIEEDLFSYLLLSLSQGVLFTLGFKLLRDSQTADGLFGWPWLGGAVYGLLVVLLGILPFYALAYSELRLPIAALFAWLLRNLTQFVVAGALMGRLASPMVLRRATRLDAPPDAVIRAVRLESTFRRVTAGMMGYTHVTGWPAAGWQAGTTIEIGIRLLHVMPAVPHVVRVTRVDADARRVETVEEGALVRRWIHHISVRPTDSPEACEYEDRIELDAGFATWLVWLFAWVFYRSRQRRWRPLARELARGGTA